ncbi:MAG: transcription elongation factor GreAB [Verrucomicrobiales bacterium]|nr:transcription elongation factor GreAB [Verrucomicrobiales bacterium]|tara:strand:- start:21608 stop:22072 length:465 start_codon:yes stop_codon:yes gene_type:complete
MNKSAIVQSLRLLVRAQYERALKALEGAHEAATGEDTKAESKYDTRGLEASYLAAGQAEQADEWKVALSSLETFEFPELDIDDPIIQGALVEAELEGELVFYLLAPAGGGLTCETKEGDKVTVIGPNAPLREQLLGKTTGDILGDPPLMILEVT